MPTHSGPCRAAGSLKVSDLDGRVTSGVVAKNTTKPYEL